MIQFRIVKRTFALICDLSWNFIFTVSEKKGQSLWFLFVTVSLSRSPQLQIQGWISFSLESVALWGWRTTIRPHQFSYPDLEDLLQSLQGKGKAAAALPVTMTPGRGKTALPMTTTYGKGKVAAAPDKAAAAGGGGGSGTVDREQRLPPSP
jgi:hypothetical protein